MAAAWQGSKCTGSTCSPQPVDRPALHEVFWQQQLTCAIGAISSLPDWPLHVQRVWQSTRQRHGRRSRPCTARATWRRRARPRGDEELARTASTLVHKSINTCL